VLKNEQKTMSFARNTQPLYRREREGEHLLTGESTFLGRKDKDRSKYYTNYDESEGSN
jgi:hypothetical protein